MRYIIFVFKSSESGVYFIFIACLNSNIKFSLVCFPGSVMVKTLLFDCKGAQVRSLVGNLPASAGDTSSIPGLRRFHMPWGH